jgi:hypothetical protein
MAVLDATFTLILRSRSKAGVSKDEATWFETRARGALLTMRVDLVWNRYV